MIPSHATDSTAAAEHREAEVERQAEELEAQRRHDAECRDGWRGEDEDGRPRPCRVCRPWLARHECRVCALTEQLCVEQRRAGRGACCGGCDHSDADRRVAGG